MVRALDTVTDHSRDKTECRRIAPFGAIDLSKRLKQATASTRA